MKKLICSLYICSLQAPSSDDQTELKFQRPSYNINAGKAAKNNINSEKALNFMEFISDDFNFRVKNLTFK